MPYFTIFHWLLLAIVILVFILVSLIFTKITNNTKHFATITFFVGVFMIALFIFISFEIDKITKRVVIEKISYRKVNLGESFKVSGIIYNKGKFRVNYCKLRVRFFENNLNFDKLSKNIYKPRGFGELESIKTKSGMVEKVVKISSRLNPGEKKRFSFFVRYNKALSGNIGFSYKLTCR